MNKLLAIIIGSLAATFVFAEPTVTDVVAKQRWPWNGLVDITCSVSGISGTVNNFEFVVAAVNSGNVHYISRFWVVKNGINSADHSVHVNGTYHLVWDSTADFDGQICSSMVVRVNVVRARVQLWEGGPYWATTNIGAEKPEDYGYYFWWGDTVGYKWENDVWVASDGSSSGFSFDEQNTPTYDKDVSALQSEGWITTGNVLAPEHDAAQAHWGSNWRMPTQDELSALNSNCDWTWTTTNGVSGYIVRGRGDYSFASIFLPATGYGKGTSLGEANKYGYYWSSVPDVGNPASAYSLDIKSDHHYTYYYRRRYGNSARPVQGPSDAQVTTVASADDSAQFLLDTRTGARESTGDETLTYSSLWDGNGYVDATVTIAQDGVAIAEGLMGEDTCPWSVQKAGTYVLTHTTYTNGVAGKVESATFNVPAKDIGLAQVNVDCSDVAYRGTAYEPAIQSVKWGDDTLVAGTDFTLAYSDNVNAGTATITLTGTNFYSGTYTTNFTIRPRPLSQGMVGAIGNHPYTGKAQTPKPTVTDVERGVTLRENVDYTLSYANNTAIGEGVVTVKGVGNYTGSISRAFVIEPSAGSELEEHLGGAGKVESEGVGGWIVTITNDVDIAYLPLEIPDNLGPVTIDLGGHDLVGGDGSPVIRIVPDEEDGEPTVLTIITTGGDATIQGGDGVPATEVAEGTRDGVAINFGDGVIVRSGVKPFAGSDIVVTGHSGEYDGIAHGVNVTVADGIVGAVVRYAAGDGAPVMSWSDASPTLTNVGSMTVWCEISAPGYVTQTNSATVTIEKRPVVVNAIGNTATYEYDGSMKYVEFFDLTTDDEMYDLLKKTYFGGFCYAQRTDVGKTYMGMLPMHFANGDANFDVTYSVTDGWLCITQATNKWITVPSMEGWTYGQTAREPSMGEAKFGEVSVTYGALGTTRPTMPGSYTATFTVSETANYSGLVSKVPFSITIVEETAIKEIFDSLPATVKPDVDGGWKVTLTNEIDGADLPIEMPDNIGHVTIDLVGHDLIGADGAAGDSYTSGGDGMPAIKIVSGMGDGVATWLSIVTTDGDAFVKGGDGGAGTPGGNGASAIVVADDAREDVKVNIGMGVTVKGGDGVSSESIASDVTREGYTFIGWLPEDTTVPASNVTYTAQWQINQYLVTFDANGGTGGVTNELDYASGIIAPDVTREGYTFVGWLPAVDATVPASNVTYTAQWRINQYSVAFDANGGVGSVTNELDYASEIVAPDVTREGYTFVGWSPEVDATVPASNVTYMAQWSINQYAVVFDANGGAGSGTNELDYASEIVAPDVMREGYTFVGWLPEVDVTVTASNVTYMAQWQINQYSVAFDANGGLGSVTNELDYASEIVVPDVTREGYTFVGWLPEVGATVPASNVTYTAQWQINQYTVAFDANGGEGSVTNELDYSSGIVAPGVAREGYAFAGWLPEVDATVPASNVTYTAQWSINQYSVAFDANGGAGGWSRSMDYGAAISAPIVTRTGYTFEGWLPEVDATVSASNVTYTAQWSVNQYSVRFDANGGAGEFDEATFEYGAAYGGLPIPTRPGFIFDGWFTSAEGGTLVAEDSVLMIASDHTLYAHWTKIRLYDEIAGTVPATAASEYGGYVVDADGVVKGTILVKVGKANKNTGLASVKATVQIGAKKTSLKASGKGSAAIASGGPTEIELAGGEKCRIVLGADGLSGNYGAYTIDGARNFFASKDKAEANAADALLAKLPGAVNVVWNGGSASVTLAKKGKAKVSGMLSDGKTKISASSTLLVGEEACCVPVIAPKANLAFTVWYLSDGGEPVVEGLGDGAVVGAAGKISAGAKFRIDGKALATVVGANVLPYLPDGVSVAQNGTKWVVAGGAKAGKIAIKNGVLDDSNAGANPSGLKLAYKAKDGTFKGAFKAYYMEKGKLKSVAVGVTGVMVGKVGYGTATVKKLGSVAVRIE